MAAERPKQTGTGKEDGADVGMFVSSVEGNSASSHLMASICSEEEITSVKGGPKALG